jgi:thiol-disulfide isomerase/thioredoxin
MVRDLRAEELAEPQHPWAVRRRSNWAWLLALAACLTSAHAAPPPGEVPGIAWFEGGVDAAFELARATNKPVFLYWGAKWCPPCQQLRSSVFLRSDFIAKSREFVAVHLDGDDPGAQRWGERFRVSGYPTVVILRADRKEIIRIAGGMDLSLYADLLDIALNDVEPMADVVAALQSNRGLVSHGECQRLAYNAWDLMDYTEQERRSLAGDLAQAAAACANLTPVERARLTVASAAMSRTPDTVTQVIGIVENPSLAPRVADALESLGDSFYKDVQACGTVTAAKFLAAWTRTMDGVADDPKVIDADRLSAIGSSLALAKQFAKDNKVPDDLAAAARARVAATLARNFDPYVRAGIVDSASSIYEQLGDNDALYAMLKSELATAKAPYYYMADLGKIEEKRGHREEALGWYARAYSESQGIATRFQWGSIYLGALLRLTPEDRGRIERTGIAVIGELDGPDRIQARTRIRLEKLDGALRRWNAKHRYDAQIKALHARMSGVCGKLPAGDAGYGNCQKFLS